MLLHRFATVDEFDLHGRGRVLPVAGALFGLGVLLLAAAPPFTAFAGKSLIETAAVGLRGLVDHRRRRPGPDLPAHHPLSEAPYLPHVLDLRGQMPQPRILRPGRRRASDRMRATGGSLVRTLEHPADRSERQRSPFDRFSEWASFLASSPLFFVLCSALVLLWVAGLILGASDRFEAAAAGLMSGLTLILVAVLKNAELRAERAVQTKLDAIASSLLEDRRGHRGDAETQLEQSIGVHDEI